MARVNTNILAISKLKRNGMGKFNSDDHYMWARIPYKKWSNPYIVNKKSETQYLGAISKTTESLFISKANHSISQ